MPGIMPGSRQVSRHPEDWYFSSFGKVFWMCVALLMASFWQGTHVLANGGDGPFYYLNLIMISLTIILEVAVCFSLIHDGTSCMESREDALKAVRLYRIIEFMIYIIMILNISITSAMASS
ncbi:uncharacterized protein LOC111873045 [Cryptotermes secundus]|uniref:uncharacterized protein LOC111873045 n=1 Tax=Cryptotermes secundus TaxID=105785 RepID=UPI000CD7B896|nr:uncharacterized protein LOC111873045 [Cryptotermes secundus]